MAASQSATVNDKGVWRATCSVNTAATPLTVYVGHLRNVTVQIHRGAGSADTLGVTGSNDGETFAAVTSKQQSLSTGDGGDVAMSAITAAIHTVRQGVEYLRFTPSGNTDTFTVTISGVTRN